jgi:hypothetical protein
VLLAYHVVVSFSFILILPKKFREPFFSFLLSNSLLSISSLLNSLDSWNVELTEIVCLYYCISKMGIFDGITEAVSKTSTSVNEAVNGSVIGRYFEMKERNTNFTTEMRGATATFMSMAYILAVNPRILADSGGPCIPDEDGIFGPAYSACLEGIRREYVTSTAIASMVGCILMGVMANLPIALAPGMGLNAYFTVRTIGCIGIV